MEIRVPDLGDFSDVEIIEVLVQAGATVAKEDGLITLETDKATMDVPSPENGVIESITVAVGDTVSTGDVIGSMTVNDGDAVASPAATELPTIEEVESSETAVREEPAASEPETITVPDLGDFSDVDVIEVHISDGDSVGVEDPLITLETDKATMDVPAPIAGTVQEVLVSVGDSVSAGSPVARVVPGGGETAPAKKADATPKTPKAAADGPAREPAASPAPVKTPAAAAPAVAPATPATLPAIDEAGFSRAHASPSVRKLARELGVDLAQVNGSGPKNRVLHDDVKAFVKAILSGGVAAPAAPAAALPAVPAVDFAKFGEIETVDLTRIQKISGPRLQASWINLPHVTQHDLADITDLENRRQQLKGPAKERGISLTPLAFVMKAVIATLKEFPKANASLSQDGKSLVLKKYCHLGFAADTENGLMVPVIRDADQMDVYELAQQLGDLSKAARDGKLKGDQLQGASFTISSLGGIGGTAFTPIVNAPEVAILGVSRSTMQPVWNGESFEPRLMLPLSLSYDHRVIDGAYAVRFTTFLSSALTNVEALLEAIP
ncbi:MAG: dihydrolipoyllysine-residue acetyltransferase [Gammaproteobacteria bacterium]|nr:dihydrolipoyllysine-residue acetyltransferase [Gammaproteobacteria bacterium]